MIPVIPRSLLRNFVLKAQDEAAHESYLESLPSKEGAEDLDAFQQELATASAGLAAAPHGDMLWAPEDRGLCLLQSFLAEQAGVAGEADNLEAQYDDDDIGGWVRSVFQWWRRFKPHPFIEPATARVIGLPDRARLAMFGDWGVGDRYGARVIGRTIEDPRRFPDPIHAVIHLGDTYYAGTPAEVRTNLECVWPQRSEAINIALNGNHEMYGGGIGYYEALGRLKQPTSYLALQNSHFTVVVLDTAYEDWQLAGRQVPWLKQILAQAGPRKVILLSHHQPFSVFEDAGDKLVAQLGDVLGSGRVLAWYWGHEHRCVVYNPHAKWGTHGRCIGHGGYPYFRASAEVWMKRDSPVPAGQERLESQTRQSGSQWFVLPATQGAPGGLLLGDNNPYMGDEADRYGAQGFAVLDLQGPQLIERLLRPDGTVILEQELAR